MCFMSQVDTHNITWWDQKKNVQITDKDIDHIKHVTDYRNE